MLQRAAAAGMTPSAFVAHQALHGSVTVEQRAGMAPELRLELSRIGSNVNQIARAVNEGNYTPDVRRIALAFQELLTFMMRDELLARRVEAFEARHGPEDQQARQFVQGGRPVSVS